MRRVRYGVIGVGGIGGLHLRAVAQCERAELAAVADADAAVVERESRRLGVPGFSSHRELLAAGLVDAVSLAVPNHLHASMAIECFEAGVHVYVEKPLAIRLSEADRVLAAARAARRRIHVGHQYRFHRSSRTLKARIDAGAIGEVRRVLWSWLVLRTHHEWEHRGWTADWKRSGGGIVMQYLIHDLDLLCWLVGRPVRVAAIAGRQEHATEVDDVAGCTVAFANGAIATVQGSLSQPGARSVREIAGDRGILVMPDVRSLTFDHKDEIRLGTYARPLRELLEAPGHAASRRVTWRRVPLVGDQAPWIKPLQRAGLWKARPHGITVSLRGFVDAILDGTPVPVSGESARTALEVANAILLSAVRGRTVDLPLDAAEVDALHDELGAGTTVLPDLGARRGPRR